MATPSWRPISRPAERTPARPRLTGLGAVLVIVVPTVLGGLLDGLLGTGYGVPTGIGFAGGCVYAAVKTRPHDLPVVMLTPPVLFVVAVGIAEAIRSWGTDSWFRDQVVAVTIALAGDAFWIVAATCAALVIGAVRWFFPASRTGARGQRNSRTAPPRPR